jgi:integrase
LSTRPCFTKYGDRFAIALLVPALACLGCTAMLARSSGPRERLVMALLNAAMLTTHVLWPVAQPAMDHTSHCQVPGLMEGLHQTRYGRGLRSRVRSARSLRRRRLRSHTYSKVPELIWTTPTEVFRIAEQATALGGDTAGLLIVTAGRTGCRWGELAGLHRDNIDLDRGVLIIDARTGSLHESAHTRWIGSPKTASSARTITLPPFLIALLRKHLERHDNEFVFTTETRTWLWRSTFIRRLLRPANVGRSR